MGCDPLSLVGFLYLGRPQGGCPGGTGIRPSGKGGFPHTIALDLGEERTVSGFAYTPQTAGPDGMMSSGCVEVSHDGKAWKKAAAFEFGNLVNDPSRRYCYFQSSVQARYIRVRATAAEAGSRSVAVSEIDIF